MKEYTIVCDSCGKRLFHTRYLQLSAHSDGYPGSKIISAPPLLADDHHFCSISCLHTWLLQKTSGNKK